MSVVVFGLFFSCEYIPTPKEVRDAQKIFDETGLNKKIASNFKSKHLKQNQDVYVEIENERFNNYLWSIADKLAKNAKYRPDQIKLLDSSWVQASSSENIIYITLGMLLSVQSEDELACILGHEMAHSDLNHGPVSSQISSIEKKLIEMGYKVETKVSGETHAMNKTSSEVYNLKKSKRSKTQEQEADFYGSMLVKKSGYNPYRCSLLFKRISRKINADSIYSFQKLKGSHHSLKKRSEDLRSFLISRGIKDSKKELTKPYQDNYEESFKESEVAKKKTLHGLEKVKKINDEIKAFINKKEKISLEQFIKISKEISHLARKNNVNKKSLLAYKKASQAPPKHKKFLEEDFKQDSPIWRESASWVGEISESLSLLGHLAIGTIPVLNDAVDLYEVVVGKDFITQKELSLDQRFLSALGLVAGSGGVYRKSFSEIETTVKNSRFESELSEIRSVFSKVNQELPKIEASPTLKKILHSPDFVPSDFYVRPNGEVFPGRAYHYTNEIDEIVEKGAIEVKPKGTWISFDSYDNAAEANSKLQIPNPVRYRVEFNTIDVSDTLKIPHGDYGRSSKFEPLSKDFPQFGKGGGTQAMVDEKIFPDKIVDMSTGEVLTFEKGQ